MNIFARTSLLLVAVFQCQGAAPFTLEDSNPSSEAFRKRFIASYGINESIEPKLESKDRKLYEAALPHIQENPREAIRIVEEGLPKEPIKPAFQFLLGNLYYQIQDHQNSKQALIRAVNAFPAFRRAYRTLGLIYIQSENYPESVDVWRKVIELGGGDAQSYGLLAYSHLSMEKFTSALAAYRQALIFKPESKDFRRGQVHCLLALESHAEASGLLEELIEDEPMETDFWLMQANLFLKQSRYQDAIANLEIVRTMEKVEYKELQLLGDLYLQEGMSKHSLDAYTSALKMLARFDNASNWIKPLKIYTQRSHLSEARQYLKTLEQILPAKTQEHHKETLLVAEGALAMESGDTATTLNILLPVVKANPMQGEALLIVGRAYHQDDKPEEAEFHFERARSIPEVQQKALIALGRLQISKGDIEKSLGFFQDAYRITPNEALSKYIKRLEQYAD